jgi:hypothetical protein
MREVLHARELAIGIALVALAAIAQGAPAIAIAGVKPNVVLTVLIILSFFTSGVFSYFIFLFVGAVLLRFSSSFDPALLALLVTALGAFALHRRLPWHDGINNLVLIGVGTVLFYILADFHFLTIDPFTLFGEAVYNMVVGTALFFLVTYLFSRGRRNF